MTGVACPLPWQEEIITRAARIFLNRASDMAALESRVRVLESSQQLSQVVSLLNDLKERLDDLEREYRHHRHQVGPGHWSGKAEV
ncbi:hypothetical protein [Desulfofundulus sp.]|uniref:hypothetical protein n=1 Tax=Desulfofundulus sp. TaxID=2282750 RepID=UPI003C77FD17